jgi:hypothetical protein
MKSKIILNEKYFGVPNFHTECVGVPRMPWSAENATVCEIFIQNAMECEDSRPWEKIK